MGCSIMSKEEITVGREQCSQAIPWGTFTFRETVGNEKPATATWQESWVKEEARLTGAKGAREPQGVGGQPGTSQRPVRAPATGFGGVAFADGCNKSLMGSVGDGRQTREGEVETDTRWH